MSENQEWKDIEEMIKRAAKQEPLPKSLMPEEIEKKLRDSLGAEGQEETAHKTYEKKRKFQMRIPAWAGLCAACLVVVLVLSAVISPANRMKGTKGDTSEKSADYEAKGEKELPEEVLLGAASEEEIFLKIDRIKNPEKYKTVGERVVDGISGLFAAGTKGSITNGSEYADGVVEESKETASATGDISSENSGNDYAADVVTDKGGEYSKTNLQEQDVDEADVVKTDGKFFYILRSGEAELDIVQVSGAQMNTVSRITPDENASEEEQYIHEFYVTGDKLILLKTVYCYYSSKKGAAPDYYSDEIRIADSCRDETRIAIYDISDRQNPVLLSELSQDGSYASSRMSGGWLYTFSDHYVMNEIKEDEPETYMPCAQGETISCSDIYVPDEVDSSQYKVITAVNPDAPEGFQTEKAVLCGSGLCYVSNNAIYFLSESYVNRDEEGYNQTEIWKFAYLEGNIIGSASGMVKGEVRDQFAISEANGYLRVVTTYEKYTSYNGLIDGVRELWGATADVAVQRSEDQKNGLYILDENLNEVGRLEDLAPGEIIYSARFFADTAYFVTFRQTDPLFSVDVSDPANPVLLGELKIPGFSEYLHPYGEGRLLGIGYEADENGRRTGIKLTMFDTSDPENVKELHTEVVSNFGENDYYYTQALYNHRAVLVDTQKNLIGFNLVRDYSMGSKWSEENGYVVYGYDDEQGFYRKMKTEITFSNSGRVIEDSESSEKEIDKSAEIRGAYIGNYLYTINRGYTIQCFDMNEDFALKNEYGF